MAVVESFELDPATMDIKMFQGDTKAFKFTAHRKSGTAWTENDRMLFTVTNPNGEIVMQRIYRLDDQYDLGDGWVLIEFHNDDTDTWASATYTTEIRVDVTPTWDGTPSTARCVNALAEGAAKMIEGVPVRTMWHGSLKINPVQGRI